MKTVVKDNLLNKQYTVYTHSSGLKVYMFKTPGFSTFHATFGTNYGSIDNEYIYNGEKITVPAGIAHFLEHKMFECSDGDAFMKFAKTGAYSNAYTSFDKTCYIFSCTNNFYENLNILLSFVSEPYFTKETVEKEQGIIGQEITMYDDMPSWRVFHNLLVALYKNHPINIDIPGTKETIAKITPELLFSLYNTFYTPSNMFLALTGDFDEDKVIEIVNKVIGPEEKQKGKAIFLDEEPVANQSEITQIMEVVKPLYALGFKMPEGPSLKEVITIDLLIKVLIGDASPLYKRLMEQELIDDDFDGDFMYGRGYATVIFEGSNENPRAVADEIFKEIENLKQNGINEKLFNAIKCNAIGSTYRQFNSPDSINNMLIELALKNEEPFTVLKVLKEIEINDLLKMLELFKQEASALSVIKSEE